MKSKFTDILSFNLTNLNLKNKKQIFTWTCLPRPIKTKILFNSDYFNYHSLSSS